MMVEILLTLLLLLILAVGYWARYRSLACPASLTFLLENPYMNAVAGPQTLLKRLRLEEGMRLLDVGSGPGRLAVPAANIIGLRGEVVALDIQPKMLEKLQKRCEVMKLENIRLVNASAGSTAIESDYFDRALLVTVLGEIPDKGAALQMIFRSLKKGGILSITEVIPDPHYTTLAKTRALCIDAGFVETEYFGTPLAFTINFSKPAEE